MVSSNTGDNHSANLNLGDVLRATIVKRWQIVDTVKIQSLAEHTYGVIVIAMELCGRMHPGNRQMFNAVVVAATLHDLPEVMSGDIPTPVKKSLGIYEAVERMEAAMLFCGRGYGHAADDVVAIVKVADLIESLWFLDNYGNQFNRHTSSVRNKLYARLQPHEVGAALYAELMDYKPSEIDDIFPGKSDDDQTRSQNQ